MISAGWRDSVLVDPPSRNGWRRDVSLVQRREMNGNTNPDQPQWTHDCLGTGREQTSRLVSGDNVMP